PCCNAAGGLLLWRDAVTRQPRFPRSMSGVAGPAMLSRRCNPHRSSFMRTLFALLLAHVISSAGTVAATAQERPATPPAGAPGVVTEGSGNVSIGGLPAARKGDRTGCGGVTVGGGGGVFINGKPAARAGDLTTGCPGK